MCLISTYTCLKDTHKKEMLILTVIVLLMFFFLKNKHFTCLIRASLNIKLTLFFFLFFYKFSLNCDQIKVKAELFVVHSAHSPALQLPKLDVTAYRVTWLYMLIIVWALLCWVAAVRRSPLWASALWLAEAAVMLSASCSYSQARQAGGGSAAGKP